MSDTYTPAAKMVAVFLNLASLMRFTVETATDGWPRQSALTARRGNATGNDRCLPRPNRRCRPHHLFVQACTVPSSPSPTRPATAVTPGAVVARLPIAAGQLAQKDLPFLTEHPLRFHVAVLKGPRTTSVAALRRRGDDTGPEPRRAGGARHADHLVRISAGLSAPNRRPRRARVRTVVATWSAVSVVAASVRALHVALAARCASREAPHGRAS